MSDPFDNQKRRPPPIYIPPLPQHAHTSQTRTTSHHQHNARTPTEQSSRPTSTPPLASPLRPDGSRVPQSGSQKSRTSAMTTLSTLMEQARGSPQKSDAGSIAAKSTTRSRHSNHSHRSANTTQAPLEALDTNIVTVRGKIEAQTEHKLFKKMGQVPPTPIAESAQDGEVIIMTQDLRAQCRAVSGEKKAGRTEPAKSPKKKLFGMHIPTFGRTSGNVPAPAMPSKAAQVFGQAPRNPTKVVVRPIKPAVLYGTPTKASRSETSKSLPSKILSQDGHAQSHHRYRRGRTANRRSPSGTLGSKQSHGGEVVPPMPNISSSFESRAPPTPPAKDTPPDNMAPVQPPSPLRRSAPSDCLRETYGANADDNKRLQLPVALSLSPSKAASEDAGKSPSKNVPCTAEEYQKLIEGAPLPWDSPVKDFYHASTTGDLEEAQPQPEVWDEGTASGMTEEQNKSNESSQLNPDLSLLQWRQDQHKAHTNWNGHHFRPLPPRFYSPSNRSIQLFGDGESPFQNSDNSRLHTVAGKADLFKQQHHQSSSGSIDMVFQGNARDIDPESSTARLVDSNEPKMLVQTRDDSGLTARVMQELRIDEQHDKTPRQTFASHLQPDQSSSRLTDMLHGISPMRGDYDCDFQPNCPSAVPSPLVKMPSSATPMQRLPASHSTPGLSGQTQTPKNLNDHFYMTNEHLDVVGKSMWDQIETLKEKVEDFNQEHAVHVTTIEKYVHEIKEIKMQVESVSEKADRTTEQSHNIHTKLEELFGLIKNDVMGALTAQDKKMAATEQSIKELQKVVQTMAEQKRTERSPTSIPKSSPFSLQPHQSPPALPGYYGTMPETGRESLPSMPQMHDQNTHNDARMGYGTYGRKWSSSNGYQGRSSKDERFSGINPYHFGGGSNYSGGYAPYNYSQGSPEQQYGAFQGQSK